MDVNTFSSMDSSNRYGRTGLSVRLAASSSAGSVHKSCRFSFQEIPDVSM